MIVLLLTLSEEIVNQFNSVLPKTDILLHVNILEKGNELIHTEAIDTVVVDLSISERTLEWVEEYKNNMNKIFWTAIVREDVSEDKVKRSYVIFDEVMTFPLIPEKLNALIRKVEKWREVTQDARYPGLIQEDRVFPYRDYEKFMFQETLERAISISRAFTASLDLDRLINLFLNAIEEMMGVSRLSLLLHEEDSGVFSIKASRGIHPAIADRFHLLPESGLILWLSSKGGVLRRGRIDRDVERRSILARAFREMEVLQAVLSVPITYEGRLISILNLGSKITGEEFTNSEIERLYVLSNYFGRAFQDTHKYYRICYQKDYIQKILDRMGSGVITINDKEEIIIFNPRAEEILQRRSADLIGQNVRMLPPPLAQLLVDTLREERSYNKYELMYEEDHLCLEVNTYGLYGPSGKVIGGVMLFEDISARKDLEKEKRKGESLQIFNELVGRMAHELRNPLVAVRTFTQLMKDRYDDPEFKEFFFTTVTGEVERLNTLIEKLIAFVHPIEYKFSIVDVGEVLNNSLDLALNDFPKERYQIIKDDIPGTYKITADMPQLCKAFSYIFQNSFKAMPAGGTLTVKAENLSTESMIKIVIKDTGKGIAEEDIKRVFDPFYTASEKGIGLGLPLSQKIIEDHKGKVSIESEISQGTTLTVTLPLVKQEKQEV